jgi:alcohol dehydrogenase (cytochrome c)
MGTSRPRCRRRVPDGLPADTYLTITAFILQSNGRTPGNQPFTATTNVPIGGAAGAGAAAGARCSGASRWRSGRKTGCGRRRRGAARWSRRAGQDPIPQGQPLPAGQPVTGEVKTFTRITEEMMRNPPPGDWLMIRHDQSAHNFSPLTQITRDNVEQLQLAVGVAE